jgi:hypothetical protein
MAVAFSQHRCWRNVQLMFRQSWTSGASLKPWVSNDSKSIQYWSLWQMATELIFCSVIKERFKCFRDKPVGHFC